MNIVKAIPRLADASARKVARLKLLLELALRDGQYSTEVVAHTTIELARIWSDFNRFYFLSMSLGASDSDGNRVPSESRVASPDEALRLAFAATHPGESVPAAIGWWKEPKWWDVTQLDMCLSAIGTPSQPKVRAAVALPGEVFGALQPFRNFYAHRNHDTAAKARRALSAGPPGVIWSHPTEILLSVQPGRPQCLLADWVDTIRICMQIVR